MNLTTVLDFVTVFFAGILAGALFVIDYGVGRAVANVLDEQAHILVRQALILRLRVLVPAIFAPTILLGIAITVLSGFDPGFGFRLAGLLVVLTCFLLTLIGTAPINQTIRNWQPSAPPKNWRELVSRWERLDRARTWAGIAAFALFLTAMTLQLAAH
jgi:uncharacterized membrane protein